MEEADWCIEGRSICLVDPGGTITEACDILSAYEPEVILFTRREPKMTNYLLTCCLNV